MGNVCDRCLSFFYEEDHALGRSRGDSSTYYPLSESSETEQLGDASAGSYHGEAKVSASLPVGGLDLDSKLLASPHSLPPSLEEEKAFNIAKSASSLTQLPKECMLCMELFTAERPEVRTLCACGVNKNSYHLECLLAWRSRSGNTMCPVCNKELFYEEGAEDTDQAQTETQTQAETAYSSSGDAERSVVGDEAEGEGEGAVHNETSGASEEHAQVS